MEIQKDIGTEIIGRLKKLTVEVEWMRNRIKYLEKKYGEEPSYPRDS